MRWNSRIYYIDMSQADVISDKEMERFFSFFFHSIIFIPFVYTRVYIWYTYLALNNETSQLKKLFGKTALSSGSSLTLRLMFIFLIRRT